MKKWLHPFSILLLLLLGASAVAGGWGLIADPSGGNLEIPLDLLQGSPFSSYVVPGIFLAFFIGFPSIIIAMMGILKHPYYPLLMTTVGFVLIAFLTAQIIINIDFYFPVLHIPYYLLGICLASIGWMMRGARLA